MNKKILFPLVGLGTMAVVGMTYLGVAKAADIPSCCDTMVQSLSQKLGISQDKVQQAMDEIRVQNQSERKAEMETNLSKAVTDGVITEAQKQTLLTKMAERQSEPGQRGKNKGEIRQWAEDNGIDFTKLKDYGFGKGPKAGMPCLNK